MDRIQLIHWNAEEAAERAERIRELGYAVDHEVPAGASFLRQLGERPPAAVVIDLTRLPSQGRDFALLIRRRATTRHVPLVFVCGVASKVALIQELLPDAVYTSWETVGDGLAQAIACPVASPVVPSSQFAAYAGKPLAAKLGIGLGTVVGVVHMPKGFEAQLGPLPEGAVLRSAVDDDSDLSIWFEESSTALLRDLDAIVVAAGRAPAWIAWPKRSSGVKSDLTQQAVRDAGLAAGIVDYKICAIDNVWSGLLFTKRKGEAPPMRSVGRH